jgi:hypothetical protein
LEDYLWRLKLFFRWFQNKKIREINGQKIKPEDVVRGYEEEFARRVCSLAVVSDGSQCPNPSQLCHVSEADHLITLKTHNSQAW